MKIKNKRTSTTICKKNIYHHSYNYYIIKKIEKSMSTKYKYLYEVLSTYHYI